MADAALVSIQAEPDQAIPALIGCLVDRQGRGRADVVEALGEFGPKSRAAVPMLVKLLADRSSKDIMQAVPAALKKIAPDMDPSRSRGMEPEPGGQSSPGPP